MATLGIKKGGTALFGLLIFACNVQAQQAGDEKKGDPNDFEQNFLIQTTPPTPERLFRLESEKALRDRIKQELETKGVRKKVEFPPFSEPEHITKPVPRIWPFMVSRVEPNYVCYRRLWFEQKNSERHGWDFGALQPVISTGVFYTDLALFPLHWAANPFRCYDCSAGQCLPGDMVPLLWNPFLAK